MCKSSILSIKYQYTDLVLGIVLFISETRWVHQYIYGYKNQKTSFKQLLLNKNTKWYVLHQKRKLRLDETCGKREETQRSLFQPRWCQSTSGFKVHFFSFLSSFFVAESALSLSFSLSLSLSSFFSFLLSSFSWPSFFSASRFAILLLMRLWRATTERMSEAR